MRIWLNIRIFHETVLDLGSGAGFDTISGPYPVNLVHTALTPSLSNRVIENTEKSMRELHRKVANIGIDALVSLSRLLGDEKVSARVRFQIAKEILDRVGLTDQ